MTGWTLTSPSAEADTRARETDGDERGDSPTARGVWRGIFEAALSTRTLDQHFNNLGYTMQGLAVRDVKAPIRALSLMAGYGSDASELRKLALEQGWPIRIAGVELCKARREHLEKWCDGVAISDWRSFLESQAASEFTPAQADGWDIIVSNPDFSHILRSGKVWSDTASNGAGAYVDSPYLPAEETLVPTLLEHAPAVLMLHRSDAFAKSILGREVARRWPAAAEWKLGPASFDVSGKMAPECYIASLFLRGHEGPTAGHTLRELTASERRWTVPPGSETPSAELPAQPGWSP